MKEISQQRVRNKLVTTFVCNYSFGWVAVNGVNSFGLMQTARLCYPNQCRRCPMSSPEPPSISGMVKVAANHFLVVHDTKDLIGPRLGFIEIQKDGPS
jgi:hypothetical protein